jgi:hypothetical protein
VQRERLRGVPQAVGVERYGVGHARRPWRRPWVKLARNQRVGGTQCVCLVSPAGQLANAGDGARAVVVVVCGVSTGAGCCRG